MAEKERSIEFSIDMYRSKPLVIKALDTIKAQTGVKEKNENLLIPEIIGTKYQSYWRDPGQAGLPSGFDEAIRLATFLGVRYSRLFSFSEGSVRIQYPSEIMTGLKTNFSIGDRAVVSDNRAIIKVPMIVFDQESDAKNIKKKQRMLKRDLINGLFGNRPVLDIVNERFKPKNRDEYMLIIKKLNSWFDDSIQHKFSKAVTWTFPDPEDASPMTVKDAVTGKESVDFSRTLNESGFNPSIRLLRTLEYVLDTKYEIWYPAHRLVAREPDYSIRRELKPDLKALLDVGNGAVYDPSKNTYYFKDSFDKKEFDFISVKRDEEKKYRYCFSGSDKIERAGNLEYISGATERTPCSAVIKNDTDRIIIVVENMNKLIRDAIGKGIEDGSISVYDVETRGGIEFEHLSLYDENGVQKFGLRCDEFVVYPRFDTMIDVRTSGEKLFMRTSLNGKFGFIDPSGITDKERLKYSLAYNYSDGCAVVGFDDGRYGYIDENGDLMFGGAEFEEAHDFSDEHATVVINGKTCIIDKSGRITVTDLKRIYRFSEGYAVYEEITDGNTLFGYVNSMGEKVVPASFTYAGSVREGKASFIENDRFVVCNISDLVRKQI